MPQRSRPRQPQPPNEQPCGLSWARRLKTSLALRLTAYRKQHIVDSLRSACSTKKALIRLTAASLAIRSSLVVVCRGLKITASGAHLQSSNIQTQYCALIQRQPDQRGIALRQHTARQNIRQTDRTLIPLTSCAIGTPQLSCGDHPMVSSHCFFDTRRCDRIAKNNHD